MSGDEVKTQEQPVLVSGPASASDAPPSTSAPAKGADGKPIRPRRWNPPAPRKIPHWIVWTMVGVSTVLVLVLGAIIAHLSFPAVEMGPPPLAPAFRELQNSYTIKPPKGWTIEDHHDGGNIYFKGPLEKGFSPLIIVSMAIAPGRLPSYTKEHKARIEYQDKTIKFVSEEETCLDGCRTMRLEYDCEIVPNAGQQPVKVRTLQYILEDASRFYRITCHVNVDVYQKYLPAFEAVAGSFERIPLAPAPYSIITK